MRGTLRGCLAVVLFLLLLTVSAVQVEAQGAQVAQYTSPGGLVVTSYSPQWADEAKLQELADELLQNVHGDEISLLSEIEIHDDYPRGNGVAGQYSFQTVSSLLSKAKMQPGKIELYGGSEHTTVASFAHTLAHEYGHHVTHYYTLEQDKFTLTDEKRWQDTTYARMRGLSGDDRVTVKDGEHRWQIAEIAAEDYVQLFGSKLAKAATPFQSRVEQALAGQEPSAVTWSGSMFNVQPQENLLLPLASEVPGLYGFFYQGMKGEAGTFTPPPKPQLKIASYSQQGEAGNQLLFSWEQPEEKQNYTYTLVTYSDSDLLAEPIVTRTAQDKHEARYGPVVMRKGQYVYTYQEPSAKGIRHFKLYVFGDNGWVAHSPELTVNMANPSEVKVSDSKVVPVERAEPAPGDVIDVSVPEFFEPALDFLNSAIDILADVIDIVETVINAVVAFVKGLAALFG